MGSESTKDATKKDLNKKILNNQKYEIQNHTKEKINDKAKRKCSLNIFNDNEEKENDFAQNLNNQINSNLCMENSINNNEKEREDNDFDEKRARDAVKFLLEDEGCFYRNLIPTINSLSSIDFKNLFEGNYDYNYHTSNNLLIKRLAHKFENFYYILSKCYKDKQYLDYFKELWLEYPYIEELKKLGDEKIISSKLSSTLPNFSSWPCNIKKDIIKQIKNTEIIACEEIKNTIKDEYIEIDKILKKLTNIKQNFSGDKDEEYLSKNDDALSKDIETIYNFIINDSENEKINLTNEDKKKLRKKIINDKNVFSAISPYLQDDIELLLDIIILGFIKVYKFVDSGNNNIKTLSNKIVTIKELYKDDCQKNRDECFNYSKDDAFDLNPKNEQKNESNNEFNEWINVAKNFLCCTYRGYKMYQTINLSEKIISENKYRIKLNQIYEKFKECQSSKRLNKSNPIENLKLINNYINKIEKIRQELLELIEKLKKEIDNNINKKKGAIGTIIYKSIVLAKNSYEFFITKNPLHLINIGLDITSIVFSGVDLSYRNVIINEIIKTLKDAKTKQKEIEDEIESLTETISELKMAYPTY